MTYNLKRNFAQAYSTTAVESAVTEASPHKLVEMLYDAAIKNLNLAKIFIEQKDFSKKSVHINKALSILAALQSGIDAEKGGDVAANLYSLYEYCYRRTFEASTKNDIEMIAEVIELIKPIAEAWKQMPENIKRVSKDQIDRMSAA